MCSLRKMCIVLVLSYFLLPIPGVGTGNVCLVDMQESTHRKLTEVDLFAPWILTHDVLPGS